MGSEKPAVIIDNGSYNIKAGFACDNHPVAIFRTVVGRPNYLQGSYGRHPYDVYIGDDAMARREELELSQPVVAGEIIHWDNMERIWHHIYYRELKVSPEDRSVILACSPTASMNEKIKCCEVFFETLNAPALCIQSQNVLALYGSGFTTGICVDLGHDTADINPIFEGGLISYAHMKTGLAGNQVSNYIKECFDSRNLDLGEQAHEIIEDIKKNYLYLTKNCAMSRKKHQRPYTLPNGRVIDVGQEAFMTAELFIQPELVKSAPTEFLALQEAIVTAAMKCDSELQPELYDGIVLCGGLAMMPGLSERLAIELEVIINRPVNIVMSPEAYAVAWLGGATFAGLPDSNKLWITKKQYEDHGTKIIKNKFM